MENISNKTEEIVWSEKDAASCRQMMALSKCGVQHWKSAYDSLPELGQKVWIAYYTGMASKGCSCRLSECSSADDGYTMAIAMRLKASSIASIAKAGDASTGEAAAAPEQMQDAASRLAAGLLGSCDGTARRQARSWKEKLVSPWAVDSAKLAKAILELEDIWVIVEPGGSYKIFYNPMAVQRFSVPSEYLLKKRNEGAPISPTQLLRPAYDSCTFAPDFWMEQKLIAGPRGACIEKA